MARRRRLGLLSLTAAAGTSAAATMGRPGEVPQQQGEQGQQQSSQQSAQEPARVALCFVGELRSIDDTAAALNANLLSHWNADAFVVGLTHTEPHDNDCNRLAGLGPRVVKTVVGTARHVLDHELVKATQNAPLMQQSLLVQNEPQTDWTRRFAEQFLTRKACRDLVLAHEEQRGFKYEAYGRMRLDTFLLEPFPEYFLDHLTTRQAFHRIEFRGEHRARRREHTLPDGAILSSLRATPSAIAATSALAASYHQRHHETSLLQGFGQLGAKEWQQLQGENEAHPAFKLAKSYGVGQRGAGHPTVVDPPVVRGVAAVPLGEDYGVEDPKGLMDKMVIGDAVAFEADASVWKTIIHNATGERGAWLMEGLHRDNFHHHGVEVRRLPLSYLIIKTDHSAKYPSELHYALKRQPSLLEDMPQLCGETGKWSCNTCAKCGIMPEAMRSEDPGFCNLIARCNATDAIAVRARLLREKSAKCSSDGSVFLRNEWLYGTTRCLFDSIDSRFAKFTAQDDMHVPTEEAPCRAASLLQKLESGDLNKTHLELVISSYNSGLQWTQPWAPIRTIYQKAWPEDTSGNRCELRRAPPVLLPNVGRESHSYLYHITANYDTLAERTVFMQDREPSCGFFMSSGELGDHLMMNVSLFDYMDVDNGDTFMPLTMKFDGNLSTCALRSTFADIEEPALQQVERPVPQAPLPGHSSDFWLPWEHNDFQAWIYRISAKTVNNTARELPPGVPQISYRQFWQKVFGRPPPAVVYFSQGGQFAASRDAIHRTPRDKYQWILSRIEEGHEELVYYCEASWFYLMHGADHPMISLDEETPAPPRWEQAHFLSHLPKKHILDYFDIANESLLNISELNFTSQSWTDSLSGSFDTSNPWSVAYFERLSKSFLSHESEPNLYRRIADGTKYEKSVMSRPSRAEIERPRKHRADRRLNARSLVPERNEI